MESPLLAKQENYDILETTEVKDGPKSVNQLTITSFQNWMQCDQDYTVLWGVE